MSNADEMVLAYVENSGAYGTLPTTPNLTNLRFTAESLKQDTNTVESEEITSDRQVTDIIRIGLSAVGDIKIEFSYGAHDDLLKALLLSAAWTSPITDISSDTGISAVAASNKLTGADDDFINYVQYRWVKISGFTGAAIGNNGYAKISAITHSNSPTTEYDEMTLTGITLTDYTPGTDQVSITQGAYIVNGTTLPDFIFEKDFQVSTTDEFAYYLGMCVSSGGIEFSSDSLITGSFSFLGKREISNTVTVGDGSNTAAPTNSIMNAVDHVVGILENQADYDTTQYSFSLNNNLGARLQVGTLGAISVRKGKISLTGKLNAYFATKAIMDKYLNFTESSLAVVMEDGAGNGYVVDTPAVKYTDGQRVAGGVSTDIMADMTWSAKKDATEGFTIQIARFPAA